MSRSSHGWSSTRGSTPSATSYSASSSLVSPSILLASNHASPLKLGRLKRSRSGSGAASADASNVNELNQHQNQNVPMAATTMPTATGGLDALLASTESAMMMSLSSPTAGGMGALLSAASSAQSPIEKGNDESRHPSDSPTSLKQLKRPRPTSSSLLFRPFGSTVSSSASNPMPLSSLAGLGLSALSSSLLSPQPPPAAAAIASMSGSQKSPPPTDPLVDQIKKIANSAGGSMSRSSSFLNQRAASASASASLSRAPSSASINGGSGSTVARGPLKVFERIHHMLLTVGHLLEGRTVYHMLMGTTLLKMRQYHEAERHLRRADQLAAHDLQTETSNGTEASDISSVRQMAANIKLSLARAISMRAPTESTITDSSSVSSLPSSRSNSLATLSRRSDSLKTRSSSSSSSSSFSRRPSTNTSGGESSVPTRSGSVSGSGSKKEIDTLVKQAVDLISKADSSSELARTYLIPTSIGVGVHSGNRLDVLNELGGFLFENGDLDDARGLYESLTQTLQSLTNIKTEDNTMQIESKEKDHSTTATDRLAELGRSMSSSFIPKSESHSTPASSTEAHDNSTASQLLNNLSVVQWQSGDSSAAAATLERALRCGPANVDALNNAAALLMSNKLYHSAIPLLESVVHQQPHLPMVWNNLGLAYERIQNSAGAKHAYDKARYYIRYAPNATAQRFLRFNIASYLLANITSDEMNGDTSPITLPSSQPSSSQPDPSVSEEAIQNKIQQIDSALHLLISLIHSHPSNESNTNDDSDDALVWTTIGSSLLLRAKVSVGGNGVLTANQIHSALNDKDDADSQSSDSTLSRSSSFGVVSVSTMVSVARQSFDRALTSAPSNPFHLVSYANFLMDISDYIHAEESLIKAIPLISKSHQEESAAVWCNVGLCRQMQGPSRYTDAHAAYQKALLVMPEFATAYNYIGNLYRCEGQTSQALQAFERAHNLLPHDSISSINLALAHASDILSPRYSTAIRLLLDVLKNDPNCQLAKRNLAKIIKKAKTATGTVNDGDTMQIQSAATKAVV